MFPEKPLVTWIYKPRKSRRPQTSSKNNFLAALNPDVIDEKGKFNIWLALAKDKNQLDTLIEMFFDQTN